MSKNVIKVKLSDDERDYLISLIKARTIQAQIVDRARMLLWKADGRTFSDIADALAVSVPTVRRCIERFNTNGRNLALFDDDRSGRPIEITDDAKAWIISIACQKPCDLGYAAELWTLAALHKHIQNFADEAGFPRLKTVTKPWLQKYLKKWISSRLKSNIIWKEKILILKIKCIMSSWSINRLRCSLMKMGILLCRMMGI